MRLRILVPVLAALALVAVPRTAGADDEIVHPDPDGCAPPIDLDEATRKARASEHYRRGSSLYDDHGEYERAIPEFFAAYCLVPAPETLYNIGQSYERLVDYERAVRWFERYIRMLPPEAERERKRVAHRVSVLRRLPAKIRVATTPPGAKVVLLGGERPVVGRANAEPLRVPAGRYRMRVELPGHEPVTQEVEAEIGQPYTYSFQLLPETGLLRVSTEPGDARIFLDDKLVGAGSFADRVPVGEHEVTVEATGREPRTETVHVWADRTTATHVKLPAPEKSGRWELLTASTLFGLAGGGTLAATIDSFGDSTGLLAVVTGGAIGFAGPYLGAPERIPVGTTSWIIGSAAWGAIEGIAGSLLFTTDSDTVATASVATSVVFVIGASISAPRLRPSAGDAALVNSGGLWGTTAGLLFWDVFGGQERLAGPLLLSGLNLGLVTGGALARRHEYSRGHVALIDLAGLAGAVTGLALADALQESGQEDRASHFALGGIGAGLVVGAILTRRMDQSSAPGAGAGGPGSPATAATPTVTLARDGAGRDVPLVGLGGTF